MGTATIDTSGFTRMVGDLVNIGGPGTNVNAAFRGEIGSLLELCMDYTPAATVAKLRERASFRFAEKYAIRGSGDLKVTMNDGTRTGEADNVWLRSGGKFYIMRGPGKWPAKGKDKTSRFSPSGARWPDRIWGQYQSLINQTPEERAALKKAFIAKVVASRGLAKASWMQIAASLGIVITGVPGYVTRAQASDGRSYNNGTGAHREGGDEVVYELINSLPALTVGGIDGAGIMQRALASRERAFDIELEHGLAADFEQLARRHPGVVAASP